MSDKIKVRVHRQEVTLRLKGIYHNKIYHDETLEGEGRIDDKLRIAEVVLKHIDDNTELGNRAINIANQATVIANNAENIANRANETSARAEENSLQAISTANNAKSVADTALSNSLEAIEKSELAIEHSDTALANSEQAVETSGRAEAKADSALSASERAEANSEIAVATSERAEQKAEQAITTAGQAVETAGQALDTANSANQKSDTAVATANEASSVANTALSNSQQAISTADSASAKADEALSASARAESKSDNAVSAAGRAESSAAQAVSTSNQALENSEQALADVQSAVDAAQRATEAAEAAEQAVQEYDGRIQQAQDDASSALSQVGNKQDTLVSGVNIKTVNNQSVLGSGNIEIKGGVESVNTKTGVVVLTGEDISADVSELTDTVQGHLQTLHDNIKDIELFKFPNATIIGEPIIDHGQVSGFSESNYLQFPFIVDLHNQPFVIDFCFTTGNNVTTQQNILDSQFGLALAIANGRGLMAISHNGTSWAGSVTGTMAIQPNTTYYARLSWNRILYKTELSTDGTTYASDMTFGSTQSPYPRTMFIGGCSGSVIGHAAHPFGGTINLNYAYLTVAGNVIWQGMDDAGLSTRADVSLGNLDELGQAKFDAKQDVISDLPTIRSGAALGATALQSVPSEYVTETELSNYHDSTKQDTISDLATIRSNASSAKSTVDTHVANTTIHVTAGDKIAWSQKQNKLIAGENITIDESTNTISATGGSDGETIKNQNTSSSIEKTYDWTGTLKEAEDQNVRELHPDWKIFITDDVAGGSDTMYTKTEVDTGFVAKGHEVIAFQAPTEANGYTWYRKYADGWVEQGGIVVSNTDADINITYPFSFSDTNYTLVLGIITQNDDLAGLQWSGAKSMSTTGFTTRVTNRLRKNWQASGMAA